MSLDDLSTRKTRNMDNKSSVLSIAQIMLGDAAKAGPLTRETIAAKVVLAMTMTGAGADAVLRDQLISELESRFSIWIGKESALEANEDHVDWLSAARKQGGRYWPRYRTMLEKKWATRALDSLDDTTDHVLRLLEDPRRAGEWDRRGLVVGHVQSGKTSNYTGLICKAADAGYKVFIVLAGIHNSLRSQTQLRLDEGFLGYETRPGAIREGETRAVGVGLIDPDPKIRPDYVTNRMENGDFNSAVATRMGIGISPERPPLLFVVKKNAGVLKNLLAWIIDRCADELTGGNRKVVGQVPLLVIDDEADNASVDTGDQGYVDGKLDETYDPKAINKLIRKILYAFSKSAYVGYTATPFANVYIRDDKFVAEAGEDLFPRSFIINLPAPSNYWGPVEIFGTSSGDRERDGIGRFGLVKEVSDFAASLDPKEAHGWMPPKHKNGHAPLHNGLDELPPSLQDAVLSFVLADSARRARGQGNQHHSMLVHVTRFTSVQKEVWRQIAELLSEVKRAVLYGDKNVDGGINARLRALWETDFMPTTMAIRKHLSDTTLSSITWAEIESLLKQAVDDIEVREINGTARDILDYEERKATGFHVIAVGGDKLSRGLTLEGLTVSYFLRASKMYDTLMQMGRWFGYRPGYVDLCRLNTTSELIDWFGHITDASEELRREFEQMAAMKGNPKDYGLKVRSHPTLMITSQVKMRDAQEIEINLAGSLAETVVFYRDQLIVQKNFDAVEVLLREAGVSDRKHSQDRPGGARQQWENSHVWKNVPGARVVDFLREYKTHPTALTAHSTIYARYVDAQIRDAGELTSWTVALLGGDKEDAKDAVAVAGNNIIPVKREPGKRQPSEAEQKEQGRYVIGRLLNPRDEAIDLDAEEWQAALDLTAKYAKEEGATATPEAPNGPAIRSIRGRGTDTKPARAERGLLLLYPIKPIDRMSIPLMGFGVSLPGSKGKPIKYHVNNVYWEQEVLGGQPE